MKWADIFMMPALSYFKLYARPEGALATEGMQELERSVPHATRGGDGRQEGRQRGYYYLHRNLNQLLLHNQ